MPNWVVFDSGFGGLSVLSSLATSFENAPLPFRLTYLNATPADHLGYNDINDESVQVELLDQFLSTVQNRFGPEKILCACNSLSVLLPKTRFMAQFPDAVTGIVEAGSQLMLEFWTSYVNDPIFLFATETTVRSRSYLNQLKALSAVRPHIRLSLLWSQACAGLATAISNDHDGSHAPPLIQNHVLQALKGWKAIHGSLPNKAGIYLGCTHYGYRHDSFSEAFAQHGIETVMINPNQRWAEQVALGAIHSQGPETSHSAISLHPRSPSERSIRFYSRYPLPEREVATVAAYLESTSSSTAAALRNYQLDTELFPVEVIRSWLGPL